MKFDEQMKYGVKRFFQEYYLLFFVKYKHWN